MSAYDKLRYIADNKHITKIKNGLKAKLEHLMVKCLQTTFVGSLSAFEKEFGHLWGQDEEHPTKEQKAMYNKWRKVRTQIFDLGNNQISFAKKQLGIFYGKYDNTRNQDVNNERWKDGF